MHVDRVLARDHVCDGRAAGFSGRAGGGLGFGHLVWGRDVSFEGECFGRWEVGGIPGVCAMRCWRGGGGIAG